MGLNKLQLLTYAVSAISIIALASAQISIISVTLCGLVNGVRDVVGALAIALFLMGGALYAIAHLLPTSLEYRKSLIGWAQAMIIGGLIGFIVVILAQPIVNLFATIAGGIPGANNSVPASLIVCS